ncbi:MAG TPA: type VI secretion system ATPase TssH [Bryobacteraceae bacterium]|nr:type VI secretion system ATPase TssH [Bryobacteraceae bacterium]
MSVNLKSLIGKLNDESRNALEQGVTVCVSRTNYNIEIEHYLFKLLDQTDGDFACIARHFGVDPSRMTQEVMRSLDKLKRGSARNPAWSEQIVTMFKEAWAIGTIDFGAGQIRTGFTILALATHEDLARLMREVSPKEFDKIQADALKKDFNAIVSGSHEDAIAPLAAGVAGAGPGAPGARPGGAMPNLDQFTVDLTANAKAGKLDPVLGRDFEIRQMIDILMRRRQNNPILTGEAGVGKSAVVEGFAQRVAKGDVPPPLRNVAVRTLDLALLQAGAGVKGEFENRLKGLIEEVKSSPTPIILFIDEAHTMIGAGGQAGQNDAANLLKPALARGEMRTIAATTWSEYKKYFEKDPALTRRFQVVKVEEPTETQCMVMLRGVVKSLEKHHKVRILDEAVNAAVKLSHRYIAGRQLPDKAVSVLDTACARLALGQNSVPPAIEDLTRQIDDFELQTSILQREEQVGANHAERIAELAAKKAAAFEELGQKRARFDREVGLVQRIRDLRGQIEGTVAGIAPAAQPAGDGAAVQPAISLDELRAELEKLNVELAAVQGEEPLVQVCVDGQIVGEVISGWTGIPLGKMVKDEIQSVLELPSYLKKRVIGQDYPLELISQRVVTSRAGLDDPQKPVGVFMLVGPSGVGKTETALTISDMLYGGEQNIITINMSEFQEAHTVSTLKGSPPGYVGYGEGGVLTEAVRRRPYSVVLLDEVEKAHPDVLELFYQVFDKGNMEDGEGREIDFKNTIIILTTNAATDTFMKLCADPETTPSAEGIVKALKPELNKVFKPAFLGRMVILPYFPIRDESMKVIIRLKLKKIQKRMLENHRIALTYDEALVEEVGKRCTEVESGARNVDNILTNTLLPEIARRLLGWIADGLKVTAVRVGVGEDGNFTYEV